MDTTEYKENKWREFEDEFSDIMNYIEAMSEYSERPALKSFIFKLIDELKS